MYRKTIRYPISLPNIIWVIYEIEKVRLYWEFNSSSPNTEVLLTLTCFICQILYWHMHPIHTNNAFQKTLNTLELGIGSLLKYQVGFLRQVVPDGQIFLFWKSYPSEGPFWLPIIRLNSGTRYRLTIFRWSFLYL